MDCLNPVVKHRFVNENKKQARIQTHTKKANMYLMCSNLLYEIIRIEKKEA